MSETEASSLACGARTLKYLVFLFNLIFFICGIALILIGGIAQAFFKEYIQFFENELKTPAMGMIILGSIILFVSFFGCCGARIEDVCLLFTFSFFLGILLIGEIAAGISIAVLRNDIQDVVYDNMNKTMYEYTNSSSLPTQTWDNMQTNFHCCGTSGYKDWEVTVFGDGYRVPDTCCIEEETDCGQNAFSDPQVAKGLFHDGCNESLMSSVKKNLGAIIGAASAIAVIQAIGIWMSCCLIRAVRNHRYEEI